MATRSGWLPELRSWVSRICNRSRAAGACAGLVGALVVAAQRVQHLRLTGQAVVEVLGDLGRRQKTAQPRLGATT